MVVRTVALPPSARPLRVDEHEHAAPGSRLKALAVLSVIAATQLLWIAILGYLTVRLLV
jgi:hypothetical protein